MVICEAREPSPVPFEAFPKPQHQFTVPHPSSLIVTEDVVPASKLRCHNVTAYTDNT